MRVTANRYKHGSLELSDAITRTLWGAVGALEVTSKTADNTATAVSALITLLVEKNIISLADVERICDLPGLDCVDPS